MTALQLDQSKTREAVEVGDFILFFELINYIYFDIHVRMYGIRIYFKPFHPENN